MQPVPVTNAALPTAMAHQASGDCTQMTYASVVSMAARNASAQMRPAPSSRRRSVSTMKSTPLTLTTTAVITRTL